MAKAHSLTLDNIFTPSVHFHDECDNLGSEQMDIVDEKDTAMGTGKESGLKLTPARSQRLFDSDRAKQGIFSHIQRQFDKRRCCGQD